METNKKSDLKPIGKLWKNKSKSSGIEYLSGTIEDGKKIMVFKNKNKRPDKKDADYNVFEAPGFEREPGDDDLGF